MHWLQIDEMNVSQVSAALAHLGSLNAPTRLWDALFRALSAEEGALAAASAIAAYAVPEEGSPHPQRAEVDPDYTDGRCCRFVTPGGVTVDLIADPSDRGVLMIDFGRDSRYLAFATLSTALQIGRAAQPVYIDRIAALAAAGVISSYSSLAHAVAKAANDLFDNPRNVGYSSLVGDVRRQPILGATVMTVRELEIETLMSYRQSAYDYLIAAIPGGRRDPQAIRDRQNDIEWANRRLVLLGAFDEHPPVPSPTEPCM